MPRGCRLPSAVLLAAALRWLSCNSLIFLVFGFSCQAEGRQFEPGLALQNSRGPAGSCASGPFSHPEHFGQQQLPAAIEGPLSVDRSRFWVLDSTAWAGRQQGVGSRENPCPSHVESVVQAGFKGDRSTGGRTDTEGSLMLQRRFVLASLLAVVFSFPATADRTRGGALGIVCNNRPAMLQLVMAATLTSRPEVLQALMQEHFVDKPACLQSPPGLDVTLVRVSEGIAEVRFKGETLYTLRENVIR